MTLLVGVVLRQAMIKVVVYRLVGLPEGDDIICHLFHRSLLDQHTRDKVRDGFHLRLAHAQACYFDRAHA